MDLATYVVSANHCNDDSADLAVECTRCQTYILDVNGSVVSRTLAEITAVIETHEAHNKGAHP